METTTQHDTTSCLRVLIRRVQQFQSQYADARPPVPKANNSPLTKSPIERQRESPTLSGSYHGHAIPRWTHERIPVPKHRGFPGVRGSPKARRTTRAGAAFHHRANCNRQRAASRRPFSIPIAIEGESRRRGCIERRLSPSSRPRITLATSPRLGSELY